jgi:predicted DNA-binding transcriptional regulator AlpA
VDQKERAMAVKLSRDRHVSIPEICQRFQISRATYYRYLQE